MRLKALILVVLMILVGCRQTNEPTAENITVEVALDTEMPMVGDATLLVTVMTDEGEAVNDATVNVQGDMTHAGMMPVIPDAVTESEEGVYSVPFEFTMGGDWIITVDVTLANGDTASVEYTVDGVDGDMGEDSDGDMGEDSDMDMGEDSDMDAGNMNMNSAVSGAYMQITNNGDAEITLVSASAEVAGMVQIHESIIENEIARMQEVEDGITIAPGETAELMPGSFHVMLMNLQSDLVEGETLALTLTFDDDSTLELDVPITGVAPEASDTVESGNLSVTAYWVRPATVMPMDMGSDDSDMGEDSDSSD